jgi:nitrogen PTS system EIIA component
MKDKLVSAREIADLLHLPLVKIQRWVHQGKIPCKFKEDGCYFQEADVRRWAEEHHIILPKKEQIVRNPCPEVGTLGRAVERGGVHIGLKGLDIFTLFSNAVQRMPFVEGQSQTVLDALLDREEIASTGIGRGVAIPHPRRVLSLGLEGPVIPVFFCESPVDFSALDRLPVRVLFFIFSPDIKTHLDLLSRLSFCLRSPKFIDVLKTPEKGNRLLESIREIEAHIIKS